MTNGLWVMLFIVMVLINYIFYLGGHAQAHEEYSYTIEESIPNFGKALKAKEKKYKQILLQAKKDWGETVDAPFLASKAYEMNVAIYNNVVKEMKLLGIYDYQGKENKEDKAKKSHNRRYR